MLTEKQKQYHKRYRELNKEKRSIQSKQHYQSKRLISFIENPSKYLWSVAKSRAKKFGLEFNISIEDVVIPEFCPIIGCKLIKGNGHRPDAPSLDRIDNSKGYIKGNVRVISREANLKKSSLNESILIKILQYMRGEI
jgi:hypothetical protein